MSATWNIDRGSVSSANIVDQWSRLHQAKLHVEGVETVTIPHTDLRERPRSYDRVDLVEVFWIKVTPTGRAVRLNPWGEHANDLNIPHYICADSETLERELVGRHLAARPDANDYVRGTYERSRSAAYLMRQFNAYLANNGFAPDARSVANQRIAYQEALTKWHFLQPQNSYSVACHIAATQVAYSAAEEVRMLHGSARWTINDAEEYLINGIERAANGIWIGQPTGTTWPFSTAIALDRLATATGMPPRTFRTAANRLIGDGAMNCALKGMFLLPTSYRPPAKVLDVIEPSLYIDLFDNQISKTRVIADSPYLEARLADTSGVDLELQRLVKNSFRPAPRFDDRVGVEASHHDHGALSDAAFYAGLERFNMRHDDHGDGPGLGHELGGP